MEIRQIHRWNLSYRRAAEMQARLAPRLVIRGGPRRPTTVAGADISYEKKSDRFFATVLLLDYNTMEVIEERRASGKSDFPYIPGLLSFREAPLLIRAFRKLKGKPDVILFDGQGIAHPRRFGLAAHMGLILGRPSIGVAKSVLVGTFEEPGAARGNHTPMRHAGETVGSALRTRDRVKPVYVSPGHEVGHAAARRIVLACGRGYRLPEPTRLAHHAVNRFRLEMRGRQ